MAISGSPLELRSQGAQPADPRRRGAGPARDVAELLSSFDGQPRSMLRESADLAGRAWRRARRCRLALTTAPVAVDDVSARAAKARQRFSWRCWNWNSAGGGGATPVVVTRGDPAQRKDRTMKGDVAYQGDHMLSCRMFRWAAIYGVIVLMLMYFAPLPPQGAEVLASSGWRWCSRRCSGSLAAIRRATGR